MFGLADGICCGRSERDGLFDSRRRYNDGSERYIHERVQRDRIQYDNLSTRVRCSRQLRAVGDDAGAHTFGLVSLRNAVATVGANNGDYFVGADGYDYLCELTGARYSHHRSNVSRRSILGYDDLYRGGTVHVVVRS